MNDIIYKITIRKIHDAGWENMYYTSAGVSVIGYVCGVSQYPRFYDTYLDMSQFLPCPYIGYFDGFPGDMFMKNEC